MGQERLTNLATISIESELMEHIPHEIVIRKFAEARARQVIFQLKLAKLQNKNKLCNILE